MCYKDSAKSCTELHCSVDVGPHWAVDPRRQVIILVAKGGDPLSRHAFDFVF